MKNAELVAIVMKGHESRDLDYKGPVAWDEKSKKACCELVKDILALANTNGGFIVIGVSETATGYAWTGLDDGQAATYDTTRLNRFMQEYAEPPINALLRKVVIDGKTFVVIEVPGFPETPHICKKDFPDALRATTLYVRTHNNESAPVLSAADFRAVVDRAVRNRSDQLLTGFRSLMLGAPAQGDQARSAREAFMKEASVAFGRFSKLNELDKKVYKFYYEIRTFLDTFTANRFTIDKLRAAANSAFADFTGWPFLFIHPNRPEATYVVENGIETFMSDTYFNGYPLLDFWRLNESGLFLHRRLAPGDKGEEPLADMGSIVTHAAEAIYCLTKIYETLLDAPDEPVSLQFRLLGTGGRRLTRLPPHMPLWNAYTAVIPAIEVEQRHTLAEWKAAVEDFAVEMSREIFLRFNWDNPNLELARDMVKKLFARSW